MKITIAPYSGFCFGVKNAYERLDRELDNETHIYIHGQLIHNSFAIKKLAGKGLITCESLDAIPDGTVIAIRSHGIPYNELKKSQKKAERVINLCCPRVSKIQSIIRKYTNLGYYTIITGHHDHPEVLSLLSYSKPGMHSVIDSVDSISLATDHEKYILVSQTTFDLKIFNEIRKRVESPLGDKLTVFETICSATDQRQSALNALMDECTAVVVVGGQNSSNTRRLADIARRAGKRTWHIESATELSPDFFNADDSVVVTAGASTPDEILDEVVKTLEKYM